MERKAEKWKGPIHFSDEDVDEDEDVITILGDSDADEEGNLDDNGSGFYYRFHTCAIYGV
jgi:hypothetical protein